MATLALPLLTTGISALAGLFGNKKQEQTQKTTSSNTQNFSSNPNFDPATSSLLDSIKQRYGTLLSGDPNLTGYQAGGLQQINAASDMRAKALQNILASRGLSQSAAGATPIANLESTRLSDSANFNNTIPLLARQQMMENLQAAGGFAASIPHGVSGTQQTDATSTQTGVTPSNMTAGTLGNLGTTLAYLYGKGAFGGKANSGGATDPNSSIGQDAAKYWS